MSTNKVLFLDIDGVLDSSNSFYNEKKLSKRKDRSEMSSVLCRRNLFWVGLFCRLARVKIVMSSSWRYFWNEDMTPTDKVLKTHKLLNRWGIKNFIGCTPIGKVNISLSQHPINIESLYGHLKEKATDPGYFRGAQILSYIDHHNIDINTVIIFDDDISDIICFNDLRGKVVKSYFDKGGFGFKEFRKAIKLIAK